MPEKEVRVKKSLLWTILAVVLIIIIILLWNPFSSPNPSSKSINATFFTTNPSLFPSIGPDNAANTVIEFYDFQCPICGLASGLPTWGYQYSTNSGYDVAGKIEDAAKNNQIKFVAVTMSFLGTGSTAAAEAALCANEQGKFWQMHDIIFSNQVTPTQEGVQFTKQQLEIIAGQITGLDQTQFKSCLESDKYLSSVQQANTAAANAGVQGTPAFIVNGQLLSNWTSVTSVLG